MLVSLNKQTVADVFQLTNEDLDGKRAIKSNLRI